MCNVKLHLCGNLPLSRSRTDITQNWREKEGEGERITLKTRIKVGKKFLLSTSKLLLTSTGLSPT